MKGKMPKKFKRYLTEPDEFSAQNRKKYSNLTLKQLKLQVGAMEGLADVFPGGAAEKTAQERPFVQPLGLQNRLQNKRNAIKRLPELVNTPHFNNGNEQQRSVQNPTLFRIPNPLFVVNTLFQILKEDMPPAEPPKAKLQLAERKRPEPNQFQEITAKSVKIHRPPRLLDHEFTRLTHQTAFSRRRIYSEEKARPRVEGKEEVELLTFYQPKKQQKQVNQSV